MRIKDALEIRGKDKKLTPNTVGISIIINTKDIKAL
jgi:hypothetical protein